jgi:hypothetical protein
MASPQGVALTASLSNPGSQTSSFAPPCHARTPVMTPLRAAPETPPTRGSPPAGPAQAPPATVTGNLNLNLNLKPGHAACQPCSRSHSERRQFGCIQLLLMSPTCMAPGARRLAETNLLPNPSPAVTAAVTVLLPSRCWAAPLVEPALGRTQVSLRRLHVSQSQITAAWCALVSFASLAEPGEPKTMRQPQ